MDWHWQQYYTATIMVLELFVSVTKKEIPVRFTAIFLYGLLTYALISGGFFHG